MTSPAIAKRSELLPTSLPPFGVNREQAAALIGVSTSLFDQAVESGLMPRPRVLRGRNIWDVSEISTAFREIPHKESGSRQNHNTPPLDGTAEPGNPWDDV